MATPRIGIIISSTRQNRFGERAAKWLFDIASKRTDLSFEMVDLRDYPLPFFEGASPLHVKPSHPVAARWSETLSRLDGYIFVTAEYNRSITGALKNALDWAYSEFNRKPAAYLGYGGVGGARAVEHLRLMSVELQMTPTRSGVHIAGPDAMGLIFQGRPFAEFPHLDKTAETMLDELAWWTRALKTARDAA